jgi:hypothetical protein
MPSAPRAVFVLFLTVLILVAACKHPPRQVSRAVYYWKNETWSYWYESKWLKQHDVSKVYIKLMDIDWDHLQGAYPVSLNYAEHFERSKSAAGSWSVEIVPVIFITNKVFTKIDSTAIPVLATRILRKCYTRYDDLDSSAEKENQYLYGSDINLQPNEIQFDCDWTISTAKKYFYFLETIKKMIAKRNTRLSATIRLHQYKYPKKTGVPPVSKGMLMVYNISDLTKYDTVNSIFEKDKAESYFGSRKKYPLPLDVALPAYSWGIIYRNKKFFMIENGMTENDLHELECFQPIGKNFFAVTEETVFNNIFLRPGDEIKIESIDENRLMQAAALARKALNTDSLTISLFDISSSPIKNYSHETVEQVYNSFR